MSNDFLPYGRQTVDDEDIAAVAAALRSPFLTTGPLVGKFEQVFAEKTGAVHAVACNSGTAALHLAALALDLGDRQAAVVPAITFLATANVVRMTGAEVVFADVDSDTGLLTPETLAAALKRAETAGLKIRAALPVHLNGQYCDMAGLAAIANARGIQLVEDACHALGIKDVGANAYSAAACFSTHPVKAIATGEGGVVTTRDADAAARMRRLRSHGMTHDASQFENRDAAFSGSEPNAWYYEMAEIGWNYRIPDVLCALGISQLKKLDQFHERRKEIAALYDRLLVDLAPAIRPVTRSNELHGWHLYVIHVDFEALGVTRTRFMKYLRDEGIGSQVHYIPLHRQPYYRRRYGEIELPGADAYYRRCLSIPLFPGMADADVERVAAACARIVHGAGITA
jgi:UDP-4-amino-4,6-dideoxy-N-acetyl-beta-L-altrosamine transaminase